MPDACARRSTARLQRFVEADAQEVVGALGPIRCAMPLRSSSTTHRRRAGLRRDRPITFRRLGARPQRRRSGVASARISVQAVSVRAGARTAARFVRRRSCSMCPTTYAIPGGKLYRPTTTAGDSRTGPGAVRAGGLAQRSGGARAGASASTVARAIARARIFASRPTADYYGLGLEARQRRSELVGAGARVRAMAHGGATRSCGS